MSIRVICSSRVGSGQEPRFLRALLRRGAGQGEGGLREVPAGVGARQPGSVDGGSAGAGAVDHVGVQVDSPASVVEHLARVKASGWPCARRWASTVATRTRTSSGCGIRRRRVEVYHLNYDLEDESPALRAPALPMAKDAACCAPSCCSTGPDFPERTRRAPPSPVLLDTSGAPRI